MATDTRPRGARGGQPAVTAALGEGFWGPHSAPPEPPRSPAGSGGAPAPRGPAGAPPLHTHQIAMCRWQRLLLLLLPVPSNTPGKGSLPGLTPPAPGAPRGHPRGTRRGCHLLRRGGDEAAAQGDRAHARGWLGGAGDIPAGIVTLGIKRFQGRRGGTAEGHGGGTSIPVTRRGQSQAATARTEPP